MPTIDWKHNGRQLFLPVSIFPSASAENAHVNRVVIGLVDTGATTSVIRPDVIGELNLDKRERRPVQTANGTVLADRYLVRLALFPGDFDDDLSSNKTPGLPYLFEREFLIHALHKHFPHEMLIGMDVIGLCDFSVSASGIASLRLP